jgi:uncharacterized protein (DUF58 family)
VEQVRPPLRPVEARLDPPGLEVRTRATFEGTVFSWFAGLFALAALALDENLVFLMACLALGCAQAARFAARRNLRGIDVARRLPHRARVGQPLTVGYTVSNPRRRPLVGAEVVERFPRGVRPSAARLTFGAVGAGETRHRPGRLTFLRRGRFTLGTLGVSSRYPLDAGGRVLVRPAEGRPTNALRSRLRGRAEARTRPSLNTRGDEYLHGVREFREGDDPRRIHWRTTARTGQLTLAEWRRVEGRRIRIILGRSRGAGPDAARRFERAVSFAATAWRLSHRENLPVHLDLGRAGTGGTAPPTRSLGRGLDALAVVRGQGGRRPRRALRRLAREHDPAVVLYVAAGPERGIKARLAAAAGRGGDWLYVRADLPEAARWVRGIQ